MAKEFSVHSSNIGIYVDGNLQGLEDIVKMLYAYEEALELMYTKMAPAYKLAGKFKAYLEHNKEVISGLEKEIEELQKTVEPKAAR